MWRKRNTIEGIALLLAGYFFQDLLHKVWHWQSYSSWFKNLPYIHNFAGPGKYLITAFEAFLTFGLFFQQVRKFTSYLAIFGLMTVILYVIAACVLSSHIFLPYYLLGLHARWYQVLLVDLVLSWLILVLIKLCSSYPNYNH